MRGRYLLAAALLLVVPTPGGADEEPRAAAEDGGLVVFACGAHRWVFLERELADDPALSARLEEQLRGRGFTRSGHSLGVGVEIAAGLPNVNTVIFPPEWLEGAGPDEVPLRVVPRPSGRRASSHSAWTRWPRPRRTRCWR